MRLLPPTRSRRGLAAGVLALAVVLGPTAALAASGDEDPNLQQTIDSDEPVVHGDHVLESGHVDMGPKIDEGQWRFLIHDDAAKADASATSVWRYPDETVLHVVDAGELTVPDDPAYAFLGAEPGSSVWVVPQTQNADVVWVGWNTQDPGAMERMDRGVTFSMTGVQGPGTMTVYLQSGSFGEPQVLWDSTNPDPQPVWVDVNTHTHANWVFTEPGVYLVRMEVSADQVDGTTVDDTELIRFAVGSSTSPEEALAATWQGDDAATDDGTTDGAGDDATDGAGAGADDGQAAAPGDADAGAQDDGQDPLVLVLAVAIVVVAVALAVGVTVAVVRGNRARRRVLAAGAGGSGTGGAAGPAGAGGGADGADGPDGALR